MLSTYGFSEARGGCSFEEILILWILTIILSNNFSLGLGDIILIIIYQFVTIYESFILEI